MPNTIIFSESIEELSLRKGDFFLGANDVGKGPTSLTGFYNGYPVGTYSYVIYLRKLNNIFPRSGTTLAFTSAYNGTNYGFGAGTNLQQEFQDDLRPESTTRVTKVSRINSNVSQRDYVHVGLSSPLNSTRIVSFWYYGTYGTQIQVYNNDNSANLSYLNSSKNWVAGSTSGFRYVNIPVTINVWQKIVVRIVNSGAAGTGWSWTILHNNVATPTLANTEYWAFSEFIYEVKPLTGPAIYACQNDQELILRTNQIDKSTERTTKEQCFSYFAGQSDKMVINKDYDMIVTDGLVLNLDSDFLLSYPATGTVWNDLSILGRTYSVGTNQTYNSSGFFDMSGNTSLQGINCTNLTLTNNSCTLIFWIKTTDTQSLFWGADSGGGGSYYIGAYSVNNKEYYGNAGSPDYFQDLVEKNNIYDHLLDGRWHMCEFKNVNFSNWTNQHNFNSYSNFLFNTNSSISKILIYNRLLTTNESISLYYGGSVVTSGLLFSFDSANLISYPSSGTTCYSLTGSNTLTLENGVGFDKKYGGRWILDGNNDRLNSDFTSTIDSVTIECWYRGTKTTRNHLWNFGVGSTTNLYCNLNDSGIPLWFYWNGSGTPYLWFTQGNFTDGNIKHLVFTHVESDNQAYLNGQLLTAGRATAGTQTFNNVNSGGSFNVGGSPFFGGDIYQVRIYNRALSPSEILQNFNAHRSRYGV